ncbi:MAG: aminotransferase [Planctomycetaceae bacterium]|nr:aminotransferase [Planctomycetaceae bacterium]
MTLPHPSIQKKYGLFAPWPAFGEDDFQAVQSVLESGKVNYWTGPHGKAFEQEFAEFVGCEYGVAVANGTVALELALEAMGIGQGDDVIVTARTFVASGTAIAVRGAKPIFADVDPASQNITAETVEAALTPNTKAVVAVHLSGWPCEMNELRQLCDDHGLKLIEDCAQAHGATYEGQAIGSLGDVAAFSFCQDKIMTTGGEGGMLTTNNADIWERAWSFKDHGKSWDACFNREHNTVFRWLHESVGTNWRMTEMQSAMGRVALQKLPEWLTARRRHANIFDERFADNSALDVAIPESHIQHSYYKYYVFLQPEWIQAVWSRDAVVQEMQRLGIPCGSGICPEIYREKVFDTPVFRPKERLPVAAQLSETAIMFPVHPTLSDDDIHAIADGLEYVIGMAEGQRSQLKAA